MIFLRKIFLKQETDDNFQQPSILFKRGLFLFKFIRFKSEIPFVASLHKRGISLPISSSRLIQWITSLITLIRPRFLFIQKSSIKTTYYKNFDRQTH